MPTALVTGLTGQDGGYLAERLLHDGYDVHGLVHQDDSAPSESDGLLAVRRHLGDLADDESVNRIVKAVQPDVVFNLGGVSSVSRSWDDPLLTAQVTGVGALRVLHAAMRGADSSGRAVRFVQASSAEIFGSPARSPQDENTAIAPTSPYGAAKALAHHLVQASRSRGLHANNAILYNHESPRRPLTFVTRKITDGVARIALGIDDTIELGNLDAIRDWGYAPDFVDAMIRIANAPEPGDYIVATGEARTVADFVATAFAHVGIEDWARHVRVNSAFVRPADPAALVGNAQRLRDTLGWRPTVDFAQLVAMMVDADLDRHRRGAQQHPRS